MKRKARKALLLTIGLIGGYLMVGIILHHYVFPMSEPDYSNYFVTGDRFVSKSEGFEQTVLSQRDGWIHLRLEVQPYAPGPPEHLHTGFAETFSIRSGTLSLMVNGEKRTLKPGELLTIPPGTPHRPFNETDQVVVVEDVENERSVTEKFGYQLSQIYPFVDNMGSSPSTLSMLLQFAVYGDGFDAWMADGPPVAVQRAMRYVMAPTARLLGYKNYYDEFRIKR